MSWDTVTVSLYIMWQTHYYCYGWMSVCSGWWRCLFLLLQLLLLLLLLAPCCCHSTESVQPPQFN